MFPAHFKNINEMIAYLPEVKKLGMNTVWINPIHLAGQFIIEKSDSLTGHPQALKGSMYAMTDTGMIDPRFSVVERDEDGDVLLSKAQIATIGSSYQLRIIKESKDLRETVFTLKRTLTTRENEVNRHRVALKKNANESLKTSITSIDKIIEKLKKKLVKNEASLQSLIEQQRKWILKLDGMAMKAFSDKAKELGLTPIFDLVLNHLASDAPYVSQHPEHFNLEDKTYPDATAFIYSKSSNKKDVAKKKPAQKLSKDQIAEIMTFWGPFIDQYVKEWGFNGARVDCVFKIPQELREAAYNHIRLSVATQKNPMPVVIIEELLFSSIPTKELCEQVGAAGATHITGSSYYYERQWHGGLKGDYNHEDFHKGEIVTNGVINFTGNHDHYSCAMTVCRELAFERLRSNANLFAEYNRYLNEKIAEHDGPLPLSTYEMIKTLFIHYYVNEIIEELNNPDEFNETVNQFGIAYRDKLFTNIYSGSGGYYILSGDEFASFHQASVFIRSNGEKVNPDKTLRIFTSELNKFAQALVDEMATKSVMAKKYKDIYNKLTAENKKIFLSSFTAKIRNEIDANVRKTKERFLDKIDEHYLDFDDQMLDEIPRPSRSQNGWQAPKAMKKFANVEYFSEINNIMSKLPPSTKRFWSEIFKARNNDILIAVRINGSGYQAPVDVIVHNLNPNKTVRLEKEDFMKIGMWLQKRGFPNVTDISTAPDAYHQAYGCIMGSSNYQQNPANLYFAGLIELDKDISEHFENVNGEVKRFNIVVAPKPLQQDPLLASGPEHFIQETISAKDFAKMFDNFKLRSPSLTGCSPNSSFDFSEDLEDSLSINSSRSNGSSSSSSRSSSDDDLFDEDAIINGTKWKF
jgi:alpha-amylase